MCVFIVPEQPTIGRGGVERLIEGYDPVEELWRESQRRHGGQKTVVSEFAGLNAASSAAAPNPADGTVASRFAASTSSTAAARTSRHHSVSLGHQPRRVHHKLGPLAHFLKQKIGSRD